MNSHAQNNEDIFIRRYFERDSGFYVDVGAHDGVQFSNTFELEKLGWRGICIEPNPDSFAKLQRNRPKAQCIKGACIASGQGHGSLYIPAGTPVLGTTRQGMDAEILRILGREGDLHYTTIEVWQMTLEVVLQQCHAPVDFDLLSIDTEWTEGDVIRGIALDKWRPKMLVVEANNQPELEQVREAVFLQSNHQIGYVYCGFIAVNHVWLRADLDVSKAKDLLECHELR